VRPHRVRWAMAQNPARRLLMRVAWILLNLVAWPVYSRLLQSEVAGATAAIVAAAAWFHSIKAGTIAQIVIVVTLYVVVSWL
jgi:hypothetical protein